MRKLVHREVKLTRARKWREAQISGVPAMCFHHPKDGKSSSLAPVEVTAICELVEAGGGSVSFLQIPSLTPEAVIAFASLHPRSNLQL